VGESPHTFLIKSEFICELEPMISCRFYIKSLPSLQNSSFCQIGCSSSDSINVCPL